MKKIFLGLAVISAMLLVSCSKNSDGNGKPVDTDAKKNHTSKPLATGESSGVLDSGSSYNEGDVVEAFAQRMADFYFSVNDPDDMTPEQEAEYGQILAELRSMDVKVQNKITERYNVIKREIEVEMSNSSSSQEDQDYLDEYIKGEVNNMSKTDSTEEDLTGDDVDNTVQTEELQPEEEKNDNEVGEDKM